MGPFPSAPLFEKGMAGHGIRLGRGEPVPPVTAAAMAGRRTMMTFRGIRNSRMPGKLTCPFGLRHGYAECPHKARSAPYVQWPHKAHFDRFAHYAHDREALPACDIVVTLAQSSGNPPCRAAQGGPMRRVSWHRLSTKVVIMQV